MYRILFPNDKLSNRRFANYDAGIAHIRRHFHECDGDLCLVVPVPEYAE